MNVKILALNCGSSTLKFHIISLDTDSLRLRPVNIIAQGIVDRIAGDSSIRISYRDGGNFSENTVIPGHDEAVKWVLEWLRYKQILGVGELDAVGHRVVHGGDIFTGPSLIDNEVISKIETISHLAPLHNEPALKAIIATREILGTVLPQVAVFDTTFHNTLPEIASKYAIPIELAEKHHIRRYGFHGLAHRYMVERYSELNNLSTSKVKLITLQLGNGCSIAAVNKGQSIDTSMGLTPLEGLIMGTRSGDVDPSLVGFLARKEGLDISEVENVLNNKSGLLGISERTRDMRELLEATKQGDKRARLAIDMFCYRIRKYIGAYLASLGGADAIIFGGGIGENSSQIREAVCSGLEWCNLVIDQHLNKTASGLELLISSNESRIKVYVIPVNEEIIIARDTAQILGWIK